MELEPYLIYPENLAYVTGIAEKPISVTKPSSWTVWFAWLLVLASLSILFSGLNMLRENVLLNSESVPTEGHILDRYIEQDSDGNNPTYYVVFEYTANDRRLSRKQQVDGSFYDRAEQGMQLAVEYSSADPSVARIAGTDSWLRSIFALIIGSLCMLFGGVFWANQIRISRRLRDRLQKGKLIIGDLLQVSIGKDKDYEGDIHTCTIVKVRFRTPTGRTIQGEKRYRTTRGADCPPSTEKTAAIFYINDKDWEVL